MTTDDRQLAELAIPQPPVLHQQLIITLFGLYSRTPREALPVAAIVTLLGDLGFDEPGVRSAVSRLKTKGVLHSVRVDGVACYELAESLRSTFSEGDQRIFSETRNDDLNDWTLALFSVPESQRNLRHRLRRLLTGLGFGTLGSGTWIAAGRIAEQARESVRRAGVSDYVVFFRGDHLDAGDIRERVATWWDLDAVDAMVGEFLELYGDADEVWRGLLGEDPAAALEQATATTCRLAFRYYVPMLTVWRRLPYRDPNLPLEYLPDGWREPQARRAFVRTHRLIAPLASRHAHAVIEGGSGQSPG